MKIPISSSPEQRKIIKFLIVGGINTGITYLVYILCRAIDLSPVTSNTLGYVIGVINSYVWNRKWVFQSHSSRIGRQIGLFTGAFLLCFGLQLAVFKTLLSHTALHEYLVQLISMIVYTCANYLINRKITFKR